ncbi:CGNR zinc finger domain-containing protein [Streptomyces sp. SP17KL33]|uniref:CGNR zinc finger domain-containing protein n=1 Tax=Streptomyces sp. SP17KL33 TaxID=3002534 RepID=UPI002E7998C2|nr:CGNR zinc finger domain-containing protein [Streptomyces sp. SP17KL33]
MWARKAATSRRPDEDRSVRGAVRTRPVRVCGAHACALRFVDHSPARNRRWCSMSRCGNRTESPPPPGPGQTQ